MHKSPLDNPQNGPSINLIQLDWRYISYKDGAEALYSVKADPNEWKHLAGQSEYRPLMEKIRKAAPSEFAPESTNKNKLKPIVEGDSVPQRKEISIRALYLLSVIMDGWLKPLAD